MFPSGHKQRRLGVLFLSTCKRHFTVAVSGVDVTHNKAPCTKSSIQLNLASGDSIEYDSLWLAHNCASLRHHATGQKMHALSELVAESSTTCVPLIAEAGLSPDQRLLEVRWRRPLPSGAQVSKFDCAWLVNLQTSRGRDRRPRPLKAAKKKAHHTAVSSVPSFASFDFCELATSESEQRRWTEVLHDDGVSLVSDLPLDVSNTAHGDGSSDSSVVQLARLIAEPSKTLYGQDFDVRPEVNPINIAYTNAGLDLHMDLAYYESPPGIQMLHCLENDTDLLIGGESLLMDVQHCAELFRHESPDEFNTLCEVPATFVKDHLEREHPAQMFYRRPHIELDPNNGDVVAVFWSPNFEGPLIGSVEEVRRYHEAYVKFQTLLSRADVVDEWLHEFQLQPGDVVVFNQRRMLHGRRAFHARNTHHLTAKGARSQLRSLLPRHLKGTYVNIDDFLSRYRVLRHRAGLSPRGLDDTQHIGCRSM